MTEKYLIRWLDIQSFEGSWMPLEEAKEFKPVLMYTLGWVIKDEETYIVVVSSKDEEGIVGSVSAIPKCIIQSMVVISSP
jgi:hypothetical protein|tara:strand:+ start:46 stop:285 length:240 start_codon:yes stop_codon:yes gene_type:complete